MKKITYILLVTIISINVFAQKEGSSLENARKYLLEKGEVILRFKATSKAQFLELNQILSVDHHHVDENLLEVQAYANQNQFDKFLKFGLQYQVTKEDNEIPQEYTARTETSEKNGNSTNAVAAWDTTWNAYPKYSEYVAKMNYWATTYPNLCTLQSIGTTPNGRTLYVLKISDNPSSDETEPEFLYTSSMHGDEITGYPTMLRFIDHLLTNYGSITEITNLVNGTELYICPLANPDGSYRTTGNDIFNSTGNTAIRANANGYDLNRNYPDPEEGLHADAGLQTNANYQPETIAFMNFEATRNFVISANYHGGAEVLNYPWDTYPTTGNANIHPHDNYFKFLCKEYADLCQAADGNLNYMDDVLSTGAYPGTTNGSAWYTIAGGRQDGNNMYNHNKEVTIEVSELKTPAAANLPFFWDRNRQALINYVRQSSYGLQGIVSDANGNPIHAKVYISGTLDGFGSWVETSPTKGDYHKVQIAGNYNVIFEAPGYVSQTISVTLVNNAATILNVTMVPITTLPTAANSTICQGQTATLSATGTGTINWYNSISASTPIATTASYTTPNLNSTTSYWVDTEVAQPTVGPTTVSGTAVSNTSVANRYLIFNCSVPTKLKSVTIGASLATGQIYVELRNSTGAILEAKIVRLSAAGNQDINLDFFLPAENGLRLITKQIAYTNLNAATSGITYPITSGNISITGNSGTGTFLQFFNWKLSPIKSNRKQVTVTVNPAPTAPTSTSSIQYGNQVPTASVADTNGFTTPTFTWYADNVTTTALQTSTSASYLTSVATTTTFYVSVTNPTTNCISARTPITVTVSSISWNVTNGLWNVAANWNPNIVPTASHNVSITSGTPTLNIDFTLGAGNTLTLNGSGSLIVEPNKVLKIAGTANFNDKSILFKSDATGTGIFGTLTGTVTGVTNVTVQRFISGRRAFRFLTPSVTTSASIYQNWQNNGVATAGIGTHITGINGATNGFDPTGTNNPSLHTYNAQAAGNATGFTAVTNTTSNILTAGVGYRLLVRGDRNVNLNNASTLNMNVPIILSARGTLKTGTVTFNSSVGSPVLINNNATNSQTNGYTLIGNPYVSPVDWHAVTKTGVSNNAYYTWDPTLGTDTQRGRYVVYTQTGPTTGVSNIYSGGTEPALNRRYLQSGQAVFIKNAILTSPAILTFAESNKAIVSSYVFKSSSESVNNEGNSSLYLTLYEPNELAVGGSAIDGALALFSSDFTNVLDENDVVKLNASGENISFVRENKELAIEALTPVVANDELFVKTTQLQANKNYTFQVNTVDFDTTIGAKMVDLYLNTQSVIDLTQPSYITFSTSTDVASYNPDRFKIVFNNDALGNGSFDEASIVLYPNPIVNNQFTLSLPTSVTGKVSVTISNMLGQTVYSTSGDATPTMQIIPTTNLEEGIYIVSITNDEQTVQTKIIVKK